MRLHRNNKVTGNVHSVMPKRREEDHMFGITEQMKHACDAWLLKRGLKSDEQLMRDNYAAGKMGRGRGRPRKEEEN